MSLGKALLRRAFGRPQGLLGRLGGRLMARMNGKATASVIGLLAIEPKDRVLEIGFGSGVGVSLAARKAAFVAGVDPSRVMVAQGEITKRIRDSDGQSRPAPSGGRSARIR